MSKKTDFIAALRHQETHPVPFSVKFTVEAYERYSHHLQQSFDPVRDTGSYVVASHTNQGWEQVRPGYYKDYFGVIWNKTKDKTLGIVENPPLKGPSFNNYRFPDAAHLPVYRFIEENNKKYPDLFHMLSIGFTLFERAWSLTGMEELMTYMLTEPAFVHDLLDHITEYNITLVENSASLGIDCVHTADDWGSQHGLLMGKDMWEEFIQPRFKKLCETAKRHNLWVSHHSCGKVEELIPSMIACGVDVFDPFQPEVMNIVKIRNTYRGKIAFWGGLSVQKTLPYGTPEEVKEECKKLLTEIAPGGGYILSPSHSLTGDIPPENIDAFLEVANHQ